MANENIVYQGGSTGSKRIVYKAFGAATERVCYKAGPEPVPDACPYSWSNLGPVRYMSFSGHICYRPVNASLRCPWTWAYYGYYPRPQPIEFYRLRPCEWTKQFTESTNDTVTTRLTLVAGTYWLLELYSGYAGVFFLQAIRSIGSDPTGAYTVIYRKTVDDADYKLIDNTMDDILIT